MNESFVRTPAGFIAINKEALTRLSGGLPGIRPLGFTKPWRDLRVFRGPAYTFPSQPLPLDPFRNRCYSFRKEFLRDNLGEFSQTRSPIPI